MTRPIEALPRGGFSPLFLPVPLSGAHRFLPIITQGFNPGSSRPGGTRAPAAGVVKEDKLYDQTYRGFASRGLQSPFLPVPLTGAHRFLPIIAQDFSPGSLAGRPRVVKEDKLYDQTYRGSASRGLQSPFLPVPLSEAHRFLPIIAQDFSPGRPCAPAAGHRIKRNIAWDTRVSTLGAQRVGQEIKKAPKATPWELFPLY